MELTALLKRSKSLVDLSNQLFIAFSHGNTVFFGFHLRTDQTALIAALSNVVRHNWEVLNHSVNAAVLEFQESLGSISKSDHFCAGNFFRSEHAGCTDLSTDLFAFQIFNGFGRCIRRRNHDDQTGGVVRIGEVNELFTLFVNRHAGDYGIHNTGAQCRNSRVKTHVLNHDLVSEFFTDRTDQIHIETREILTVFGQKLERSKARICTDKEDAVFNSRRLRKRSRDGQHA